MNSQCLKAGPRTHLLDRTMQQQRFSEEQTQKRIDRPAGDLEKIGMFSGANRGHNAGDFAGQICARQRQQHPVDGPQPAQESGPTINSQRPEKARRQQPVPKRPTQDQSGLPE